ncbi:TPM domain-containing protein [Heyndrickxia coagulans]|uniref:TPM domain-containing protein n=1 Tax=Heyndrickxia coagulans TaxID=1398 RepID=UPI00105B3C4C|nr:TPM domain-containing protein [Heyndrickxia coagulans]MBF8418180.1 TPM domain-containing protein [Heyndrickxia coagulans]
MKRAALITAVFLALLFAVCTAVPGARAAAGIPKPAGDIYVQDFAGVLTDSQKQELVSLGRQLDEQTKAQVAVLTVDTTGKDTNIDAYANKAFRQYGLGNKTMNNGVLLVVAVKDRKIRIEVGYGLEGALPDGKVGRILDQYAIPYLKENKPDAAVINTYKKLAAETAKEYNVNLQAHPKAYERPSSAQASPYSFWKQILIGLGILILIFIDFKFLGGTMTYFLLNILSMFFRGGGGGGGGSKGGGGSSGGGGASRGW